MTAHLKVFIYNQIPYIKIIPCKRLFNSTTIHEVVTRGDMFALNLLTSQFTVLPNGADSDDAVDDFFIKSATPSSKKPRATKATTSRQKGQTKLLPK